jgi:ribosome biogenesis SPOUT family RNA methylase Rps3
MRTLAGPSAEVHFTHLSKSAGDSLASSFEAQQPANALATGLPHQVGVLELMTERSVPLDAVCLLDPKAEAELSPEDGDGRFTWFLFGVSLL